MKTMTKEIRDQMNLLLLDAVQSRERAKADWNRAIDRLAALMSSMGIDIELDVDQLRLGELTTTQIAKLSGVCKVTVQRWCDKGYFKSMKTKGGHRRIRVEEWLAFQSRKFQETTRRLYSDVDPDPLEKGTPPEPKKEHPDDKVMRVENDQIPEENGLSTYVLKPKRTPVLKEKEHPVGQKRNMVTNDLPPENHHQNPPDSSSDSPSEDQVFAHTREGTPEAKSLNLRDGQQPARLPQDEWLTSRQAKALLQVDDHGLQRLAASLEAKRVPVSGKQVRVLYSRESVMTLRGTSLVDDVRPHPQYQDFVSWYSRRYREVCGQATRMNDVDRKAIKQMLNTYGHEHLCLYSLMFFHEDDPFWAKQGRSPAKLQSYVPRAQSQLTEWLDHFQNYEGERNAKEPRWRKDSSAYDEMNSLRKRVAYVLSREHLAHLDEEERRWRESDD